MKELPKLTDRDKVRMALDEAYRTMDFSGWCTRTVIHYAGNDAQGRKVMHHCALGYVAEILQERWGNRDLLHRALDESLVQRIATVNDTQGLLPVRILLRDTARAMAR